MPELPPAATAPLTAPNSALALRLIPLTYREDSADYFDAIRPLGHSVWLDSGMPCSTYGRFDILSAAPARLLNLADAQSYWQEGDLRRPAEGDPFALLQALLPLTDAPTNTAPQDVPFIGGLLGYAGYDLGRRLESLPNCASADITLPHLRVGLYPWAIVQDHQRKCCWLVINQALAPAYNFSLIEQILEHSRQSAAFHEPRNNINSDKKSLIINKFENDINESTYHEKLARIQDYIAAGDCYQINYAQRFSATYAGDPLAALLHLRRALPSPFSAYMEFDGAALVSVSPERFVLVDGQQVLTQPIKGTVARGQDAISDARAAAWLSSSAKDRAENVMIVDLLRNDLSKVCDAVQVPALCELQSFPNVHHLVSSITGRLRDGVHPAALLRACFPGGSITGAPKIRAMEIIDELEPTRRSAYCGSFMYLSAHGRLDTSITIRTLVFSQGRAYIWGGGGITADSDSASEYAETLAKVGSIMQSLERAFAPQT